MIRRLTESQIQALDPYLLKAVAQIQQILNARFIGITHAPTTTQSSELVFSKRGNVEQPLNILMLKRLMAINDTNSSGAFLGVTEFSTTKPTIKIKVTHFK